MCSGRLALNHPFEPTQRKKKTYNRLNILAILFFCLRLDHHIIHSRFRDKSINALSFFAVVAIAVVKSSFSAFLQH